MAFVHFGFAFCCAILFDKDELKEFEMAHDCEDAVMRFYIELNFWRLKCLT